jgi:DNA processing protein
MQPSQLPATELPYWLALWRIPDIGPIRFAKLLRIFPRLEELFKLRIGALTHIHLPAHSLAALQKPDWAAVEKDLRWAEAAQQHIITLQHPDYPAQLKEIASAPPLLFVKGHLPSLASQQLAIVGSRNPSIIGKETALSFAQSLSQSGLTITSGLALGIDGACHQGALRAGGKTIAVLGSGIDIIYPKRHKQLAEQIMSSEGAVISELPTGVAPMAENFPRRNRIVSGLSLGVLVVEATLHSGSLITAHLAAEQGREVFAIPGSIHNPLSRGCHVLIRQGAKLVETAQDILEELPTTTTIKPQQAPQTSQPSPRPHKPRTTPLEKKSLDEDYQQLLECIGFEATAVEQIATRCGVTPDIVGSMVLILELNEYIAATEGGYTRLISQLKTEPTL